MTTIVTGNKAEFRQIVLNCCNVLRKTPTLQFFGLCLAPAFRVQGCVLCAAGAHADADDLSTPAVGSKKQEPPENRHWQCATLRSPKMRVRTLQ